MSLVSNGKTIPSITKSSFDNLDYSFNWKPDAATLLELEADAAWLKPTEIIVSSKWIASDDIKLGTETSDDTSTTVWISAGTKSRKYEIFNEIVTNSVPPRTIRRSFILDIT